MAEVGAGHYFEAVAAALEEVLRGALVGVYVHGSLALGGFVPERSDVDMLVLTSRSLTNREKQEVANRTSQASLPCPALGLELSVVTVEGIREPSKRVRFEVHVDTKSGRTVDGAAHHGDSDLVLHFAVCRAAGIALRGPHPRQVFPEVPRSWLLEGFAAELAWAEEHADWGNGILNACRNWRYLEEGKIGSKVEGAAWAAEQVPDPTAIDQAVAWKMGLRPDPPSPEMARPFMAQVREQLDAAAAQSKERLGEAAGRVGSRKEVIVSQTNAIIVRIREEEAEAFERLFEEEELPIWKDFLESGKFLAASLTRVEYGGQAKEGVRDYIVYAELPGMAEHEEHDSDPRFTEFLSKARRMQPEAPLVWGGTTVFQVRR